MVDFDKGTYCLNYFPISVLGHHDQSNLKETEFIGLTVSEGKLMTNIIGSMMTGRHGAGASGTQGMTDSICSHV